ncbi:MAG: hypothetical protein Q8O52_27080 [Sulfuritalea sp.]|nr:hypothetical protein [Sulfuritalea sp.]
MKREVSMLSSGLTRQQGSVVIAGQKPHRAQRPLRPSKTLSEEKHNGKKIEL